MWYVYALYSVNFNKIYVGMFENPSQRLKDHNRSKVKSTKAFVPWEIVMIEQAGGITKAKNLEKYYKSAIGKRKIKTFC